MLAGVGVHNGKIESTPESVEARSVLGVGVIPPFYFRQNSAAIMNPERAGRSVLSKSCLPRRAMGAESKDSFESLFFRFGQKLITRY